MIDWWKQRHERRRQRALAAVQAEFSVHLTRAFQEHGAIEQQIKPVLQRLTTISHKISVQQFMLEMLIASHPAIDLLVRNWDANKPNLVDELHEFLPHDDEVLRQIALDTWQAGLGRFSEIIEQTMKARRDLDGIA